MCTECARKVVELLDEMEKGGEFDGLSDDEREVARQTMGIRLRAEMTCPTEGDLTDSVKVRAEDEPAETRDDLARPSHRKCEPTERGIIEFLWDILDDIDTAGDVAKGDDKAFRRMVEKHQKRRWETGITTDGYKLDVDSALSVTLTEAEIELSNLREFVTVLVENYREIDSALQTAFRNVALLEARTAGGDVEAALRQANQNKQSHLNALAKRIETLRDERDALQARMDSLSETTGEEMRERMDLERERDEALAEIEKLERERESTNALVVQRSRRVEELMKERDEARERADRMEGHWQKARNSKAETAWSDGYDEARREASGIIRTMREEIPKRIDKVLRAFVELQAEGLSPTMARARLVNEAAGMNLLDETTGQPETETTAEIADEAIGRFLYHYHRNESEPSVGEIEARKETVEEFRQSRDLPRTHGLRPGTILRVDESLRLVTVDGEIAGGVDLAEPGEDKTERRIITPKEFDETEPATGELDPVEFLTGKKHDDEVAAVEFQSGETIPPEAIEPDGGTGSPLDAVLASRAEGKNLDRLSSTIGGPKRNEADDKTACPNCGAAVDEGRTSCWRCGGSGIEKDETGNWYGSDPCPECGFTSETRPDLAATESKCGTCGGPFPSFSDGPWDSQEKQADKTDPEEKPCALCGGTKQVEVSSSPTGPTERIEDCPRCKPGGEKPIPVKNFDEARAQFGTDPDDLNLSATDRETIDEIKAEAEQDHDLQLAGAALRNLKGKKKSEDNSPPDE